MDQLQQDDGLSAKFQRLLTVLNKELQELSALVSEIECKMYWPRLESSVENASMWYSLSLNGSYWWYYDAIHKELPSIIERINEIKKSL